jgi:polyketide biosynthesis acyl carrier protein
MTPEKPMSRDQILAIVVKHLRMNVDGLEDRPIDPSKSMRDFGATSLDMVEVVSASMHELRIRIPRTRFANLANIDELVDLFHAVKSDPLVEDPSRPSGSLS